MIFDISGGVTNVKGNAESDNLKSDSGLSGGCLTEGHLDLYC
jgi:hypothetical protein